MVVSGFRLNRSQKSKIVNQIWGARSSFCREGLEIVLGHNQKMGFGEGFLILNQISNLNVR